MSNEKEYEWGPETTLAQRITLRFKEIRKQKGINQGAIAYSMGISRATLSSIENNRYPLTFKNMERYADALGIFPEELFTKKVTQKIDLSRIEKDFAANREYEKARIVRDFIDLKVF